MFPAGPRAAWHAGEGVEQEGQEKRSRNSLRRKQ